MTRVVTWMTICGAVLSVLAVALRYLIPVWPAAGVDLSIVDTRLMLLQYGSALFALGGGAMLAWHRPERSARFRMSALVVSLALVLAFSGLRHFGDVDAEPRPNVAGPYRFSTDWVSRNTELWTRVLGQLRDKPETHGLEIGSFEGRSSIWFLDNILTHPTSSITCIDVWSYVGDPLFGDRDEKTFDGNIAAHGQGQKVVKRKGFSEDMLPGLKKEFYDFVYIDGSHRSRDALVDAVFSWRLLKPGGYMIFDDYARRELRSHFIPHKVARMGIDAFLKVFEPHIDIIHRDFQVVVRKKEGAIDLESYRRLRAFIVKAQHWLR
jgi:hypothetical protein